MKPELFLANHSAFSRAEFLAALRSRGRGNATVDSHLTRWRRQGRVVRVKPGVFLRVEEPVQPGATSPDFLALASRMAPDAVLGYHTALEAHGVAQSVFERFTFLTWTKTRATSFRGRRFVPVRPRAALAAAHFGLAWVESLERRGIAIRVTTVERTVADVLDRPGLSGGIEEVWRSLQAVPAVDPAALETYVLALDSRTAVAKVGFYLESRREELAVPDAMLERLRAHIPRSPVYMDRERRGRLVARWALFVPSMLLGQEEGGWL